MSQRLIILSCLLAVLGGVESDIITVREGQDAKIKCSYRSAYGNIKYFCKDPCTETDILFKSDWYQSLPKRFSLVDHGSSFTVTISKVRSTDSGLYYCGVERFFKDKFNEITLEVITAVPSTTPGPTSHRPSKTTAKSTRPEHTSLRPSEQTTVHREQDGAGGVVYICAGLAAVVFLLVLCLFMLYTQRTRGRKSLDPPAGHRPNTDSGNTQQGQCDYSDITFNPHVSTSSPAPPSTDPSTIYANVQLPSNQNPDSLQYATVRFTDPPAGGDKGQSPPGIERERAVIYSSINL
ncbi:CMRF35-like molecule 5 [Clupea harengus]|uniref:CMRF35-like molecule 5 n=1 Tax=Clupea harengus TaxID=7950 RepID=A0A6P8EQB1_CLUHA|nr:CMRF35-like molecule 5 [Clupea harengus]